MGNEKRRQRSRKQMLIAAIVVVGLAVVGAWALSDTGLTRIHFELPNGAKTSELKVEVVATERSRQKGLMYVKEMPREQGMLFIFPQEQINSFWMRNTYISLDMIFIDQNKKVIGLIHEVPILSDKQRSIEKPSTYVLEVLAGVAKELGVVEGAVMKVSGKLPKGS